MIQRKIENGPSKMSLMFGFFDKLDNRRRTLEFSVEAISEGHQNLGPHRLDIVINELQWEDGSGENWNFNGYVAGHTFNFLDKELMGEVLSPRVIKVNGFYSTATRKGHIKITSA
jgi:hypothetical protein